VLSASAQAGLKVCTQRKRVQMGGDKSGGEAGVVSFWKCWAVFCWTSQSSSACVFMVMFMFVCVRRRACVLQAQKPDVNTYNLSCVCV